MPDSVNTHPLCEYTKSATRSRILSARRSVATQTRAAADGALCAALLAEVTRATHNATLAMIDSMDHDTTTPAPLAVVMAGYVPLPGEPGGHALPDALATALATGLATGLTSAGNPTTLVHGYLLLPVLNRDNDLDWARYQGPERLRTAGRRLREPVGPTLGPDAIASATLIVTPAVAVDRGGNRLGRGGGSYDRALARVPAGVRIIAPLYQGELVDRLPTVQFAPMPLW